jgi:hypothetical protein
MDETKWGKGWVVNKESVWNHSGIPIREYIYIYIKKNVLIYKLFVNYFTMNELYVFA